jgi:uncharacterized protein (TIGR02217 family)
MAFLDVRFPTDIAYGSRGGPGYSTTVNQTWSGYESRQINWSLVRHRYNAAYGTRTQAQLEALLALFHAARGMGHAFRFKDWADFKSCAKEDTPAPTDQAIGTGDGATDTFQLVKVYDYGGQTYTRTITKPVSGTVRVAVDGSEKTLTTHFTVNLLTGIVTFTPGNIPTAGQAVTAGYEFDVPVRFDIDTLDVSLDDWLMGAADAPLVEVRE